MIERTIRAKGSDHRGSASCKHVVAPSKVSVKVSAKVSANVSAWDRKSAQRENAGLVSLSGRRGFLEIRINLFSRGSSAPLGGRHGQNLRDCALCGAE